MGNKPSRDDDANVFNDDDLTEEERLNQQQHNTKSSKKGLTSKKQSATTHSNGSAGNNGASLNNSNASQSTTSFNSSINGITASNHCSSLDDRVISIVSLNRHSQRAGTEGHDGSLPGSLTSQNNDYSVSCTPPGSTSPIKKKTSSSMMTSFLRSRNTSSSLFEDENSKDGISGSSTSNSHDLTTLETYFKYLGCKLLEYIGRGTFAHCFKVIYQDITTPIQNNLQTCACLKLVETSFNPKIEDRLKQEIHILKQCQNCKYVTKLYSDYRIVDMKLEFKNIMKGSNWIVQILEYGDAIMKVLKEYDSFGRYFSIGELFAYFTQAIECLYELHETYHIIHRDVKLSNILLKPLKSDKYDEQYYQFMLCDFNVSLQEGQQRKSSKRKKASLVGTSIFVPSEVLFTGEYTTKVDVYAMGVVFALLFGMVGGDDGNILLERFCDSEMPIPQMNDTSNKKSGYGTSYYATTTSGTYNHQTSYSSSYYGNNQPTSQTETAQIDLNSLLEKISSKYYLNIPVIGNLLLEMIRLVNERPTSKQMYETNLDYIFLYFIVNGRLKSDEATNMAIQTFITDKYLTECENIIKYIILQVDHIIYSTCYDIDIICNCIRLIMKRSSKALSFDVYCALMKWILQCDKTNKKHLTFLNQMVNLINSQQDESNKLMIATKSILNNEYLYNSSNNSSNLTNTKQIESLHYFIDGICNHESEKIMQFVTEFNNALSKTNPEPSMSVLVDSFIKFQTVK